jgi:hypothetical protein
VLLSILGYANQKFVASFLGVMDEYITDMFGLGFEKLLSFITAEHMTGLFSNLITNLDYAQLSELSNGNKASIFRTGTISTYTLIDQKLTDCTCYDDNNYKEVDGLNLCTCCSK